MAYHPRKSTRSLQSVRVQRRGLAADAPTIRAARAAHLEERLGLSVALAHPPFEFTCRSAEPIFKLGAEQLDPAGRGRTDDASAPKGMPLMSHQRE
jgi:hypothetical protein